jgi:hypothetical protein
MATKIKVNPDIRVFAVYSALNGLGYDPGMDDLENPPHPTHPRHLPRGEQIRIKVAQEINRRISDNRLLRDYFEHARLRKVEVVNPFWPRAYLLLLTSFHLNNPPSFHFIQDSFKKRVIDYIRELPIDPEEQGSENIEWVLRLPEILREFWSEAQPEDLWAKVAEESLSVGYQFLESTHRGHELFKRRFSLKDSDILDIIIVPNLLQIIEVLDVVKMENIIYLVAARLSSSSVIHELLHEVIGPLLRKYQELIDQHVNLMEIVWSDMRKMQYAASDKAIAWRRVFEENFVRAATIWVDSESDVSSAQRAVAEASYGFIFVPPLLESLKSHWAGLEKFEDFLIFSFNTTFSVSNQGNVAACLRAANFR